MEHLTLPPGASDQFEDYIPYLGSKDYLEVNFFDYRKHKGYEFKALPIEYLQSWLFFGWLRFVLGEFVKEFSSQVLYVHEDFVKTAFVSTSLGSRRCGSTESHEDDPERYPSSFVSTARLIDRLEQWRELVKPEVTRLEFPFKALYISICIFEFYLMHFHSQIPTNHKLSIFSTIEVVEVYIVDAFAGQPYYKNCISPLLHMTWSSSGLRDMRNLGWCPYDAYQLLQKSGTLQTALYFEKLDKNQSSSSIGRHQTCDTSECRKSLLSPGSHHKRRKCDCPEIEIGAIQEKDISALLESRNVPLLSLRRINGVVSVKIVPRVNGLKYTALSHVCADGLGNEEANALRQCQLSYILDLLTALTPTSENSNQECLVWVDTLCVPRKQEMRRKAISLMRDTYQKAEKVLVLDAELEATDHRDMDFTELLARIVCSGWTRRLWTLQEGFLARTLWIQFRDGAVNIDERVNAMNEQVPNISTSKLYAFLKASYFGMRIGQAVSAPDPQFSIRSLAMTLPGRLTSNYEDEPVCLSTLLDLPLEVVLGVPGEARMLQFWRLLSESLGGIPDYIIFGECPRFRQEGFQWAPLSLLKSKVLETALTVQSRGVKLGSLGDEFSGLRTELPGIQLFPVVQIKENPPLSLLEHVRLDDGEWHLFEKPITGDLSLDSSQYAIIYSRTPDRKQTPGHALLVKVLKSEANVKVVSRIRSILVPVLRKDSSNVFEAVYQYMVNRGSEGNLANAGNEILRRDPSLHDNLLAQLKPQSEHAQEIQDMLYDVMKGRRFVTGESLPETQKWIVS